MDKIFNTSIEQIIRKRISVRTYVNKGISEELKESINGFLNKLSNPFNVKVTMKMLESETANKSAKLGTYGVIQGASNYFGASVKNEEFALEALGYEFEKLILYLTSLGLGTCWLGGTFKRGEFAKAMSIDEDEIFPAVSPFGYESDQKSIADSLVRFIAKGDSRKPWTELFFNEDFSTSLLPEDSGTYKDALEMVRLAPSASNKQPWRIVQKENMYHFYESKSPGYSKTLGYDIQRIDMGIAACHFHLTAIEKGLKGEFQKISNPISGLSENICYIFSWVHAPS